MKKLFLTIAFILIFSFSANAKSGDIAGKYYSTDIVTTLNGVEIDAINIGGQTLISAEDMNFYGFNVNWDAKRRELRILSMDHADRGTPPQVKKSSLPSGSIIGNYYETDIVTYLDNKPITAYNIGGRTYIHAEEMRKHGHDAIWSERERTLTVTSSKFAGYEFSILLTQGQPQETEGQGCFKITYDNGKILGYGDADYFSTTFNSFGASYSLFLQFSQIDGLFYSSRLLEILRKYADTDIIADEEIHFSVNGKPAKNLTVSSYNGNGHNSFYIHCNESLKIKEEEIKSIELYVGDNIPSEAFEIPRFETSTTKAKELFKTIKKHTLDWLESFYVLEEYTVLNVCESESLGNVTNRLYVIDKNGKASADVLDQIRKIEGFNEDKLRVYATKVGDIKTNLFFSCASSKKNGDFYLDVLTSTVHLLAQKDR